MVPNYKTFRDDCHEQQISHGGRFKTAFAEREKKQTMIDLDKEVLKPVMRLPSFSRLWAQFPNLIFGSQTQPFSSKLDLQVANPIFKS
jgi:hypothetical protein